MNVFDFTVPAANGSEVNLGSYEGSVLLIVNTASKCGFTPQFAGLEQLWKSYGAQGLVVLGFPCNQFANQDPGANEEIVEFCQKNYGVTFPIMGKVDVNGSQAAPLFAWLSSEAHGFMGTKAIKWNFTKFLVDQDGEVITRFGSREEPESLAPAIESALAGPKPE